jgi:maspardin
VNERYPSARRAVLRTGGDFPFLSRPDEVTLYLQLHMRQVGVEPRPDLVQGFTRGGSSGSSNDHKDGNSFDDHPKDDGDRSSVDSEMEHSESESPYSVEPIPASTVLANTVLGTANSAQHVSLLCS